MVTQVMGFGLATPRQWRLVLFISFGISVLHYLMSPFIVESPSYLNRKGLLDQQKSTIRRLWGETDDILSTDRERILIWRDQYFIYFPQLRGKMRNPCCLTVTAMQDATQLLVSLQ
jgi:hypothetical protein